MSMRMDSRSPFDRQLELLPPPQALTPFEVELAAKLLAAERRAAGSVTPSAAARRSRMAPAAAMEETREERKQRIQRRFEQVYRYALLLHQHGEWQAGVGGGARTSMVQGSAEDCALHQCCALIECTTIPMDCSFGRMCVNQLERVPCMGFGFNWGLGFESR